MNLTFCVLIALPLVLPLAAQSQPVPPTPPASPALPGAVAPVRARMPAPPVATPSLPLAFGWRENDQLVLLEIDGDKAVATLAGQPLPADRVRRRDGAVQVLDADGLVAAQVTLYGTSGTLQTFPERNRVVLGLRLLTPDATVATRLGFKPSEVRRVGSVTPGLGAARVGLQPGDLMVELAGERPVTEARLRQLLATRKPGDLLPVRVRRGEQLLAFEVPLERATPAPQQRIAAAQPFVQLEGNRMVVVPPAPPDPVEAAAPIGSGDPLAELRSVQQRLEKMERLLQRIIELRDRGAERDAKKDAVGADKPAGGGAGKGK